MTWPPEARPEVVGKRVFDWLYQSVVLSRQSHDAIEDFGADFSDAAECDPRREKAQLALELLHVWSQVIRTFEVRSEETVFVESSEAQVGPPVHVRCEIARASDAECFLPPH